MVVRGMAYRAGWSRCQRSSGTYDEHERDRRRTRATATAPDMANLAQEIRYHLQAIFSYHVMAAAPAEVMAEERASRRFRNCADH